ncbi:cobyrinate a,c-diamide synthase [Clostridium sp. AF32-12BH]|nr:cobyrinate a,c-diamide synthase [Clostridium sp. AF32-12BH]
MTKSEVRSVSVSKLELEPDHIVYDIGAGTGSVSVEMALHVPNGHVYAFEQKEEGCELIRNNAEKAGLRNLTVVAGKAPDSMEGYQLPDRVFIGGSGGNLGEILDFVTKKNPNVQIVINVIALESLSQTMEWMKQNKREPEVICMQVSRAEKRGPYHMMQAQNPIYIITMGPEQTENKENKQNCYPRILLAAPGSGSGKTLMTVGLLTLFQRMGIACRSFKCGPDYIDPMFHKYVLGIDSCNLDSFFLPESKLRDLFESRASQAELSVIEGVMGFYDGIGGNSLAASTYEVAKITNSPVILVVDGKGSSLSLAAQIKGFLDYRRDSHICGVILNRTNKMVGERLRPEIEKMGVKYLGAVPVCETVDIKSRHLGLTMPEEQKDLRKHLAAFADQLAGCLDMEAIFELAGYRMKENAKTAGMSMTGTENASEQSETPIYKNENLSDSDRMQTCGKKERCETKNLPKPMKRIAVALDEAFCFYYQENLNFLKEHGWEIVPFSPLHDTALPPCVQAMLLGGGYPELYAKQLSENTSMLEALQNASKTGIRILAECGGFLYLQKSLEDEKGVVYPMAGLLPGDGYRTGKLGRFGYISLEQNGAYQIRGHEFHYWDSTAPGDAFRANKPQSNRGWDCMYQTDRLLAGFPHLYYLSGPDLILNFLNGEETI